MKEPVWITREILLAIQASLIARFGGLAGIRDEGLLDTALARPQQLFHYENPGPTEMAASYAAGIVKNHPFIDGNKRAGFMAAYTFLAANGLQLTAPEEEAVVFTLALAAGELDAAAYAAWLERSVQPRS
ncbi:MAG: type II toxin-antitoxin system death-on-curing family toxin [Verrucomicrobiales bacterium]